MAKTAPIELIYSLVGYPQETEWIEFKTGNTDPERIGRDIAALANAAAWLEREYAYKIWGVNDKTHELVGTTFNYLAAKAKGNEDLLIWLKRMLTPNANYEFKQFDHDDKHFVVLTIHAAHDQPVCFEKKAYFREGSNTTALEAGSAREAELWNKLQRTDFESRLAIEDIQESEIEGYLDLDAYYELLDIRIPETLTGKLAYLREQELVKEQDNGRYAITNLGALLVARHISDFSGLRKRPLRVLTFAGKGNREIVDDTTFDMGYALALIRAEEHIMARIPAQESTEGAFRRIQHAYPRKAIRELLSNTVIHQDLKNTNQGPLVSIYSNRIEFSNPGTSLISPLRVLNAQPKTRNNELVRLLRQMDLCEEGGTGWDIAVASLEDVHMLPPKMETDEELGTRVMLYRGLGYEHMTKRERMDALYWHACLRYADGEAMSNYSLRERFGLGDDPKDSLAMSRLIRDGCREGLIKIEDVDAGTKNRKYLPGWA